MNFQIREKEGMEGEEKAKVNEMEGTKGNGGME